MTTPTGITTASWPGAFGPQFERQIISAIVGGAPFARSLSPLPTDRESVAWPVVNDVDDPEWIPELGLIPTLGIDEDVYTAATSKLAGSVLISNESIDDSGFPLTQQLTQVLQDTFSGKLDRDMIGGTGPAPTPNGILSVADEVSGADLELAAIAARAEIANAGGAATNIAVNPTMLGEVESARDELGHPLYPDAATTFAGLATVVATAATTPLVYDRTRLWLVVRRDFSAETSTQASEAWNRYATSLRVVGRFALAAPMPNRSVRKLAVSTPVERTRAPAKKSA